MPGLAVIEEFVDPAENPEIELRGAEVVQFPKHDDFKEVHLRVLKFDVHNEILRIRKAKFVA